MRCCRVVLPLVLGLPLYGGPISIADTAGTTFSVSFVQVDTTHDTAVSQEVDTFSLQLIARMQGGPVLYSQFFSVPFANPTFQTAIGTAQGVLAGAGALGFLGPTLQSSSTALVNSVPQTVVDNVVATQLVGILNTVGPDTITIGDFGICQSYVLGVGAQFVGPYALPSGCTLAGSPLAVPGGTQTGVQNFDARTLTLNDIFTTTTATNTFLTTQSYEIIGLTAAIPEPASIGMLAIGLSGLFAARRILCAQKKNPS